MLVTGTTTAQHPTHILNLNPKPYSAVRSMAVRRAPKSDMTQGALDNPEKQDANLGEDAPSESPKTSC